MVGLKKTEFKALFLHVFLCSSVVLNIVKAENYTGVLKGIKAQYLIFEDSTVFNVRANEGLVVSIEV